MLQLPDGFGDEGGEGVEEFEEGMEGLGEHGLGGGFGEGVEETRFGVLEGLVREGVPEVVVEVFGGMRKVVLVHFGGDGLGECLDLV